MCTLFTILIEKQVSCPHDYRSWLQTMYILFGTKWAKIFNGPMWSYAPIMQTETSTSDSSAKPMNPVKVYIIWLSYLHNHLLRVITFLMKALVNIPGLSERTIRRDIAASNVSTGAEIQV